MLLLFPSGKGQNVDLFQNHSKEHGLFMEKHTLKKLANFFTFVVRNSSNIFSFKLQLWRQAGLTLWLGRL